MIIMMYDVDRLSINTSSANQYYLAVDLWANCMHARTLLTNEIYTKYHSICIKDIHFRVSYLAITSS